MIELHEHGAVTVLQMQNGENRLNRPLVDAFHAALDSIEANTGPCALVTIGAGKFYSNGLDLDWMGSAADTEGFLESLYALFGRIVALDVYTVAAVNGHAFAAGAMLASAHDVVVMNEDRGYWCLPEIDIRLPLTREMHAVLSAHLPHATLAEAALTGRRFTAREAVAAGIVKEAIPREDLMTRAVQIANEMSAKDRGVTRAHKALLYGREIAILQAGSPPIPSS